MDKFSVMLIGDPYDMSYYADLSRGEVHRYLQYAKHIGVEAVVFCRGEEVLRLEKVVLGSTSNS